MGGGEVTFVGGRRGNFLLGGRGGNFLLGRGGEGGYPRGTPGIAGGGVGVSRVGCVLFHILTKYFYIQSA